MLLVERYLPGMKECLDQRPGQEANAMVDMRSIENRLAKYGSGEHLCWARAGYYDGMMC